MAVEQVGREIGKELAPNPHQPNLPNRIRLRLRTLTHSLMRSSVATTATVKNENAAAQKRVNEKLAGRAPAKPAAPNIDAPADAVIRGDYGNGDERKRRLGNLYGAVQARVNQKLGY